jgi:hypothetical protein
MAYFPKSFSLAMLTFDEDELLAKTPPPPTLRNQGSVYIEQPTQSLNRSHVNFCIPKERRHVGSQTNIGGRQVVYSQVEGNEFVVFLGLLPMVSMKEIPLQIDEDNSLIFLGPIG